MAAKIVKRQGKKLVIEVEMELEGDMLTQEEAIQLAVNEAGKLATKEALESFDSNGNPIENKGEKLTSKGKKKKTTKRASGKSK